MKRFVAFSFGISIAISPTIEIQKPFRHVLFATIPFVENALAFNPQQSKLSLKTIEAQKGDVLLASRSGSAYNANDQLVFVLESFSQNSASFFIYSKKGAEGFSYGFSVDSSGKSNANSNLLSEFGLSQMRIRKKDERTLIISGLPEYLPFAPMPSFFSGLNVKEIDTLGNVGCMNNPAKTLAIGREFYVYTQGSQPISIRVINISEDQIITDIITTIPIRNSGSGHITTAGFMFKAVPISKKDLDHISNNFCNIHRDDNFLAGLKLRRISEVFSQTSIEPIKPANIAFPDFIPNSLSGPITLAGKTLFALLGKKTASKIVETAFGYGISNGTDIFPLSSEVIIDYANPNGVDSSTIAYQLTKSGISLDCLKKSRAIISLDEAPLSLHPKCKS